MTIIGESLNPTDHLNFGPNPPSSQTLRSNGSDRARQSTSALGEVPLKSCDPQAVLGFSLSECTPNNSTLDTATTTTKTPKDSHGTKGGQQER